MGDAADDAYDAAWREAEHQAATRDGIKEFCARTDCRANVFRDDEGFLTCRDCGESFDD